jgi:hypothetical protein
MSRINISKLCFGHDGSKSLFDNVSLHCQTAPKIDPQSASNFDPLELSVMASPRGRGGELIGFCV